MILSTTFFDLGVMHLSRRYELGAVRRRLGELGIPDSLLHQVIAEEEEFDDEDIRLTELMELFEDHDGESSKQIDRMSAELAHYKQMEDILRVSLVNCDIILVLNQGEMWNEARPRVHTCSGHECR